MDWGTIHYNAFPNQEAVDKCVLISEGLAEKCDNETVAIELLKNIAYLRAAETVYFVPDIVLSWEEMALSYIESNSALFDSVYYPQIQIIYQKGCNAFSTLEQHVKNHMLPEHALFGMIRGFNIDVGNFNKICREHNKKLFRPYVCQDMTLNAHYKEWEAGTDGY